MFGMRDCNSTKSPALIEGSAAGLFPCCTGSNESSLQHWRYSTAGSMWVISPTPRRERISLFAWIGPIQRFAHRATGDTEKMVLGPVQKGS